MDKDSKLIFENYRKNLFVEAWSYDPNNGQQALQQEDPNALVEIDALNNLLARAADPASVISFLMNLQKYLNPGSITKGFVEAYLRFKKSGETGNLKLKINDVCSKSLSDANSALNTVVESVAAAKQQGKDAAFIGKGLDMNIAKIEKNLRNIINLQKEYDKINESELQKRSTGASVLETDTKSPSDYFKEFSTQLNQKGISATEPTNIEDVVKAITTYISNTFSGSTQTPASSGANQQSATGFSARGNSPDNAIQIPWSQFSNGNTSYRKEDFINKKFKDNRSNIYYEVIDG